ncbi:MAG TPA: chemotaxis protein CheC [Pyrinomonadaceae bacterium]|jgi:chemotaxis protein CheC|nr:chemotaxis protein CheC [Pyrinomonadaceae bacterium]
MILTERQTDALGEFINIAFSRTASSLSEITGQRVLLDVPQVEIYQIDEVASELARFLPGDVASIHQPFDGTIAGDAFLILNYEGAVRLTDLLTEGNVQQQQLDESAREVLTEVGNILLNACLGMFGNVLQVRVNFSVPNLHLESLNELIDSVRKEREGLRYAIIVYTSFRIRESAVTGYLVLVLSIVSLKRLIEEIEKWETRQEQEIHTSQNPSKIDLGV